MSHKAVAFRLTQKQARFHKKFIDMIRIKLGKPDYYYDVFNYNGTVEVVISKDDSFDPYSEVDLYQCPTIEAIASVVKKYFE